MKYARCATADSRRKLTPMVTLIPGPRVANGNQVSVSGLLFKDAGTPTLVAHRIRLLQ